MCNGLESVYIRADDLHACGDRVRIHGEPGSTCAVFRGVFGDVLHIRMDFVHTRSVFLHTWSVFLSVIEAL